MKRYFFLLGLVSTLCADQVVCIHGFFGSPWNMHFLAKNIRRDGFEVESWGYASRDQTIEEHGADLAKYLKEIRKDGEPIHFVTHSMGGLVLLSALNNPECPNEAKIGRVVSIAPPLRGATLGRWLGQSTFARWVAKDNSGRELMTENSFDHLGSYPKTLDGLLIVSGSFGFNPFLKGESDGTVLLDETRPDCPHEHVVIPQEHKTIIFSKKCCRTIRHFLGPRPKI